MAVNLSPVGGVAAQFFTNTGVVLTGGKLFTYAAGTTTNETTYTTSAGNVAHTNPIILDAAGRVPSGEVWLTDGVSYKFVLKDSNDVLIATYDNITGINPTVNASQVIYNPAGTGAVTTTVQAKLRQVVSVKDFGAVGNGTTDDTAAIQAAIDYVTNTTFATTWPAGVKNYDKGGGVVVIPPGRYRITSGLLLGQHVCIQGTTTNGFFYPNTSQTTGSLILADFANPNQWVFSSANYNISGQRIGYRDIVSGAAMDAGTWNFTHGIEIRDIAIDAISSCYGGIKLNGSPNSKLENIRVYLADVGYLMNASWGVSANKLLSITYLYGFASLTDVNGLDINGYFDNAAGKTLDASNRLPLPANDFNSTVGLPDFSNKKMGFVSYYTNTLNMSNVIVEKWQVACIHVQTTGLSNNALYTEGNTDALFATVTCSGVLNGMFSFNPTLAGDGYFFGFNSNITLAGTPVLGYSGGGDTFSNVKIENSKPDAYGWKYSDAITFIGAPTGIIRVAAAGLTTNIAYDTTYTTLDEAIRRIVASPLSNWKVIVKDGDIVTNNSIISLVNKNIAFVKESSGSACSLIFELSPGSVVYRWELVGNTSLRFDRVDIGYTGSTSPSDATLAAGIYIEQGEASNISLAFSFCTIALQTSFAIIQQGFQSASNLQTSFRGCTVTGSSTARIMSGANANDARTNVINAQNTTTTPASVIAIGTNGFVNANIIASNFV
jgi:hypothetical protein